MRAIIMDNLGDPNVYRLDDVPNPEISRGDDVLIKVLGAGVCYRDVLARRGAFPGIKIPIIPGHEVFGEVVDVGSNVKDLKIGDKVASLIYTYCNKCEYCRRGLENLCINKEALGETINGSYAEYIVLPERVLIKAPGNLEGEAAIAACVIGTLIRAFKYIGNVKEGDKVLVTGSGGGIGIHAVQVAKSLGAEVIAVTSSEWKAPKIEEIGPDHLIISRGNFSKDVKALTGGKGVDYVLESVGGPTLEYSIRSLRRGGKVILVGNVDPKPQPILLGLLILRENSIHGSLNSRRKELSEALEMLSKGKVKPIVKFASLNDVVDIHKKLEKRQIFGRVILKP